MKRILLSLLAMVFSFTMLAQPNFATVTGSGKNIKVRQVQPHPDGQGLLSAEGVVGQKLFDNTIIGTTWYDLQSYTNVMQRIWAYPDGTVGATWMSAGMNLSPERGAGYNYYDGSSWGTPNPHVGPSDRMGWPCYAPWGPNGEILALYRYVAGAGPIQFYKRENKGEGDWVETILDPPTGCSLVWHSICTSGENHEYIHLLAYTYDAEYLGQTNALLYYRSADGGETWDISEEIIDGLGSDYFPGIHSLTYSWANPVGNTIAFTYGFDELGGWIFKSTDNGDTWQKTQVMETYLDPFNIPTDMTKFACGSGASAIVLDSQGNAHVTFGRMAKEYTGGTQYFYPFSDGMIYWNESMPLIDTALISTYTLDYLYEAGMLCGWVLTEQATYSIPDGEPNYNSSSCAFPQMSIDADDNIFVAWSGLAPDYTNGEFIYRHIVANSTYDLGNSWVGMIDLNTDIQYIFSECAYPMMPIFIEDEVHVVFQEDPYPGIAEWLTNHDAVENNIMHMAIDKNVFVSVEDHEALPAFEVATYPNPASDVVHLQMGLKNQSEISVELTDQLGRTIMTKELGRVNAGNYQHAFDVSSLSPGIYFIRVCSESNSITKKIVVR